VFLDDVGDRAVEEHVAGFRVEELGELGPVGARPTQVSRGPGAQRAADAFEQRLVRAEAVDVGGRERGDLLERALAVGVDGDRRAVGERAPEAGVEQDEVEPVAAQASSSTTSGCNRPTTYAHGLTR
jgi:hypothetical protein